VGFKAQRIDHMKVKIKRWHGVAIWKWDIADEEVNFIFPKLIRIIYRYVFRFVVFAECLMKLAVLE